jgi:ribonuclease R
MPESPLETLITSLLRRDGEVRSFQQLQRMLGPRGAQRRQVKDALALLVESGEILELSNKHYIHKSSPAIPGARRPAAVATKGPGGAPSPRAAGSGGGRTLEGRLSIAEAGFGFVRPIAVPGNKEALPPDVFIPQRNLGTAMNGDKVVISVVRRPGERGPEGMIEEVIERAHEKMVGYFQRSGKHSGRVTPRSHRIGRVVTIPDEPPTGWPTDYHWVLVRITKWTESPQPLVGEVVEVLGSDQETGMDVLLIVRDLGIEIEFPTTVIHESEQLSASITDEITRRTDFRPLKTVTIDPSTAKDFDDALSIELLGGAGGGTKSRGKKGAPDSAVWRLYVHIADVSHYVQEGTALDDESWSRATSVYPVDRVVPMLPERLSGDLCSLRPHLDRLTMTARMDIDADGHLVASEFYNSVIHSNHRLTYEQVQAIFDDSDADLKARHSDVVDDLHQLKLVAEKLRARRMERGALDLDLPETQIHFDAQGATSDIQHRVRLASHGLVEECMLLANVAVAEHLTKLGWPMIYRVHETADPGSFDRLVPMLACFGIKMNAKKGITQEALQGALEQASKLPAGHILRRLILRALTRARYSPKNMGHFGLASECYCHFTSPIRRYPDLVVHRILRRSLAGEKPPGGGEHDKLFTYLTKTATQSSDRERLAQQAEWDSVASKALEFMEQNLGEEFDGYICGVMSFGFFVELERFPVEGLVSTKSLPPDRYVLDELGVSLVAQRRGKKYRLADRVRVRIENIDRIALRMDLKIVEAWEPPPRRTGPAEHFGKRRGRR